MLGINAFLCDVMADVESEEIDERLIERERNGW